MKNLLCLIAVLSVIRAEEEDDFNPYAERPRPTFPWNDEAFYNE